jgi:cell division protease FtsH
VFTPSRLLGLDKDQDRPHGKSGDINARSQADLANLINEAAIAATRRKADDACFDDFTVAIERIVAGIKKKSKVLSKEERRRVSYHEMGHALVAASLPGVDPVQKVSIIPCGVGALGYTVQRRGSDGRRDRPCGQGFY